MFTPRRFTKVALLVLLALVAAACSSSAESATTEPIAEEDSTTTTTVEPAIDQSTATAADDTEPDDTEPDETEPDVAPVSEFEAGRCEFDPPADVNVECGWITVPQHWDDPADPDTIRLHVATFTNNDTPADAMPVVYLEGGPGGDSFGLVSLTFEPFAPILDDRPLVMFTQRGSALSEIDLECEEVVEVSVQAIEAQPDIDAELAAELDALSACAERLISEGADLSAYHSVASAHDVDAVRAALGYDTWNVLGISYGTRLGQELARTHPEGVASLILDSVQPTDPRFGSLAARPTTFEGSLDQLFAGCEADAACAAENPNLEERVRALVAQADETPIELVALDQITGERYDAIIDGDRLTGSFFQAMYSPEVFAGLPDMVRELEEGTTSTLAVLIGLQITNAPLISTGMYAAVMCHDFLAELTPESAWDEGLTGDELFDGSLPFDSTQFCNAFPTGSADASVIEPVESDLPTLILAGAYDPITPPSFAEVIEPGFSNSQYAVLPHVGHGVVLDDCGMGIARAFMADPTSQADTSCIETSVEPRWVPASLEGIGFEPFEEPLLGVTGVIPEGWDDQGFGISVRTETNIAHQAALIQQAGPIPPAQFLGLVGEQLGGEAVAAGTTEVAGRTWDVYDLEADGGSGTVYIHEDGGFTFLVVVIAPESDLDDLERYVVGPVLENLQQG